MQTEFPEEMLIRDIDGNGEEVFAINQKGLVFYWNLENSVVFKSFLNSKNDCFKEIYVGK